MESNYDISTTAIENRATPSSSMVCSFKVDNSSVTQKITIDHNPIAKLIKKLMSFGLGAIVNRQRATEAHSIPYGRNPPAHNPPIKICTMLLLGVARFSIAENC